MQKKLHLFKVPDAYQFIQGRLTSYLSPGDTAFTGENKRFGVCFIYCLVPTEKKGKRKGRTARISAPSGSGKDETSRNDGPNGGRQAKYEADFFLSQDYYRGQTGTGRGAA
mgnify:CR=1 FL=1